MLLHAFQLGWVMTGGLHGMFRGYLERCGPEGRCQERKSNPGARKAPPYHSTGISNPNEWTEGGVGWGIQGREWRAVSPRQLVPKCFPQATVPFWSALNHGSGWAEPTIFHASDLVHGAFHGRLANWGPAGIEPAL